MGHKSIQHSTDLLEAELNNSPLLTDQKELWISLHSSDPGPDGDQSSFEIKYQPYARFRAVRASGGDKLWKIENGSAHNLRDITWPVCDQGVARATWFGVGTKETGSGKLLRRGPVLKPKEGLIINAGTAPKAGPGTLRIIDL